MTRKRKWSQLTGWFADVNSLVPHLVQFLKYEQREHIKIIRKNSKNALFIKNKEGEELTPSDRKRLFSKFFGR